MTSIELTKSIYERAIGAGKDKVWLSENQERYLFQLLTEEGMHQNFDKRGRLTLALVTPDGQWRNDLTHGEAIKIGEQNIKTVVILAPPFYIKRQGFSAKRIVLEEKH